MTRKKKEKQETISVQAKYGASSIWNHEKNMEMKTRLTLCKENESNAIY